MKNIKLGLLGATGMAGREAIKHDNLLGYADLEIVTGSESSAGQRLGEIFDKREKRLAKKYEFWNTSKCPEDYKDMKISKTDPELIADKVDYVISALPSSVAAEVEPELRRRGIHVFSNSSSFRWSENVPLLIPEINYGHMDRVENQERHGRQANNPNCTTAGYIPVIGILRDSGFSIKEVNLTTMQSISGKGGKIGEDNYRNWISGNVVDDWNPESSFNGEEQKSEIEPQKILGISEDKEAVIEEFRRMRRTGESSLDLVSISAETRRVNVQYGHLESLIVRFEDKISVEGFKDAVRSWSIPSEVEDLPSTPDKLVEFVKGIEPERHCFLGDGMTVAIGDVRKVGPRSVSFVTLSHNLRRGATWTARQSMELYLSRIEHFEF